MVWFKIDDGFWSHPKVIELSPDAGWLWARAGSYCANQLTDGKVSRAALRMLGATLDDPAVAELVDAGLWLMESGGFQFHDWADYQPTREQVLAEREAAAERMRRVRANKRANVQENEPRTSGDGSPSPSRPVPSRPGDSTKTSQSQSRTERANDETDSLEVSATIASMAAQQGITDVHAVVEQVQKHTGRTIDAAAAVGIARHLLGKAKGNLRAPQKYVLRSIALSPFEVQQFIDESGMAA